jgi:hypothetical protein
MTLVLYVLAVGYIYPKTLLKLGFYTSLSTDRGIKTFTFPEGRAVVYEPHPVYRKYIDQYMLFVEGGYKYVKCHVFPEVSLLSYDVYMFDSANKVIDVIRITERIDRSDMGANILLHENTSYVKIILKKVNNTIIKTKPVAFMRRRQVAFFYSLTVLTTVIEALIIRSGLLTLFKYAADIVDPICSPIIVLAIGAIFGLALAMHSARSYDKTLVEVIADEG